MNTKQLADRLQSKDKKVVDDAFEKIEEMDEEEIVDVYEELDSRENTFGIGVIADYLGDVYDRRMTS